VDILYRALLSYFAVQVVFAVQRLTAKIDWTAMAFFPVVCVIHQQTTASYCCSDPSDPHVQ
jgi:hypothetical protein